MRRSPRYTTKRFISSFKKNPNRLPGESVRSQITGFIEGVATYFETLTEHSDPKAGLYYTIAMRRPVDCPPRGKDAR